MSPSGAQAAAFFREIATRHPRFRAVSMPLDQWRDKALPDLDADDTRVGLHRSGQRPTGWDVTVDEVPNRLVRALGGRA